MAKTINTFLGANSAGGFASLYEEIEKAAPLRDMMVLKGGPGVGKSKFMKILGAAASSAGLDVEYVWCSSDPDSLDAVIVPQAGTLAVDGTAPHVVEPKYPAAVDRYLDLGMFYDVDALKAEAGEIVRLTDMYDNSYAAAYRCIAAKAQVEKGIREMMGADADIRKIEERTKSLVCREVKRGGGEDGTVARRFLGGITCRGEIWKEDTINALCGSVFELQDPYGFGRTAMREALAEITSRGWDTICFMNPLEPETIDHIAVPGCGVAFVRTYGSLKFSKTERRMRFQTATDAGRVRATRARRRFSQRIADALCEESVHSLAEAKEYHDELEAVYNPYVDFDGVAEMAERETRRMLRAI